LRSLKVDFEKRKVPSAENNAMIGRGFSHIKCLKELSISGSVQVNTIDSINKECMVTNSLKKVERLVLDFESIKKTSAENFISLFSAESLKSVECTKRNLNILPYLSNNGIKVKELKFALPLGKMMYILQNYITFTAPELQSLSLSLQLDNAKEDNDLIEKETRLHRYPQVDSLRKLHFHNLPEVMLRDYFRRDNHLFMTDFSFRAFKDKSSVFYQDYLPRLGHGHLQSFLHEFHGE
jgi:hypothetical protein